MEKTWGGVRVGAGRPKGSLGEVQRKQHQVRSTEEEWELIKEFAQLVKKDMSQAKELLAKIEQK